MTSNSHGTAVSDPAEFARTGQWVPVVIGVVTALAVQDGDFVEFELQADTAGIALAAARVESLARHLGCTRPESRSYLEMLLSHP